MKQTRWGILGPGNIAQNFADGLAQATSGKLVAIASTSADRRAAFGDRYKVSAEKRHSTYEALIADKDVDAVYISTPHPWHAHWAIKAMRGGKVVLVEKPAGMNAAEVVALTEVVPASVRTVGFSLCYSLATALFGGFTPAVSTALIEMTGDKAAPGLWMTFAAVCGLIATLMIYRRGEANRLMLAAAA